MVSGSAGLSPWEQVCPTRCCSARWPLAGAWRRGPRRRRYPSGHPGALSWFLRFPSRPPSRPVRHLRSPAQGPPEKQRPGSEINTAANRKALGQTACPCPRQSRVTFILMELPHFHYSAKQISPQFRFVTKCRTKKENHGGQILFFCFLQKVNSNHSSGMKCSSAGLVSQTLWRCGCARGREIKILKVWNKTQITWDEIQSETGLNLNLRLASNCHGCHCCWKAGNFSAS